MGEGRIGYHRETGWWQAGYGSIVDKAGRQINFFSGDPLAQVGIIDTDLGPVVPVQFDELLVALRDLVEVMGLAIGKDQVQGHVKVPLVDLPVQIGNQRSDGKVDRPVMPGEIMAAGRTKFLDPLRTVLMEGEIDDVGKLLFCHGVVPFFGKTGFQAHGLKLERIVRILDLAGLVICCVVPVLFILRGSVTAGKSSPFQQRPPKDLVEYFLVRWRRP